MPLQKKILLARNFARVIGIVSAVTGLRFSAGLLAGTIIGLGAFKGAYFRLPVVIIISVSPVVLPIAGTVVLKKAPKISTALFVAASLPMFAFIGINIYQRLDLRAHLANSHIDLIGRHDIVSFATALLPICAAIVAYLTARWSAER